ncbi:hypothetical protein NPIL_438371 [Nephila pilipes]|uniref:Uncharacterized protein n=1 Tax=Nephila pilipes TaxID=299642 RepID=A0A8X6TX79_NEPPI|nr:hypothetical protein NPIL_438371 [Nephila pilipes]
MLISDLPVVSSSGFQDAENVGNNSEEDLEKPSDTRVWKKINMLEWYSSVSPEFKICCTTFAHLTTPTSWCPLPTFVENRRRCEMYIKNLYIVDPSQNVKCAIYFYV